MQKTELCALGLIMHKIYQLYAPSDRLEMKNQLSLLWYDNLLQED